MEKLVKNDYCLVIMKRRISEADSSPVLSTLVCKLCNTALFAPVRLKCEHVVCRTCVIRNMLADCPDCKRSIVCKSGYGLDKDKLSEIKTLYPDTTEYETVPSFEEYLARGLLHLLRSTGNSEDIVFEKDKTISLLTNDSLLSLSFADNLVWIRYKIGTSMSYEHICEILNLYLTDKSILIEYGGYKLEYIDKILYMSTWFDICYRPENTMFNYLGVFSLHTSGMKNHLRILGATDSTIIPWHSRIVLCLLSVTGYYTTRIPLYGISDLSKLIVDDSNYLHLADAMLKNEDMYYSKVGYNKKKQEVFISSPLCTTEASTELLSIILDNINKVDIREHLYIEEDHLYLVTIFPCLSLDLHVSSSTMSYCIKHIERRNFWKTKLGDMYSSAEILRVAIRQAISERDKYLIKCFIHTKNNRL